MGKYSQADRPLAVTTPLGPDDLLLVRFHGIEEISRLFQFDLEMLAESGTAIPFDKLLGQKVSVRLKRSDGGVRWFAGILRRLTEGKSVLAADGQEFVSYRAEVVPQLWLWTKRVRCAIYQQITVPDILKQVFAGLDVSYQIQGTFEPRDYCVQYRESDFDFASRLMEEEGIYYFFEHSAAGHRLVLANTPAAHPSVPGPTHAAWDPMTTTPADDRVFLWEKSQELRSGKVTLWDYSFELPDQHLETTQVVQEAATLGTVSHSLQVAGNDQLEIYDYPGRYAQRFDGVDPGGKDRPADLQKIFADNQRTAAIRLQEETAAGLAADGESYCRQFTAGHKFTLERHPTGKGSHVLTRVEHTASLQGGYLTDAVAELTYANRFQTIPPDLPFRPARTTPRPVIAGTQTAVVVGPSGKDTFVDKYGRVKVQFPWDRQGKKDANSSCWVRVGQIWAGKHWGAFFWPRVGHEVIVAFEEGDPDRPIVVGSVYNSANQPPFPVPENVLVNGIKSCSVGKGADVNANFNGVLFHDKLGEEHVQIHSERNELSNSESSKRVHIGQKHLHVVGGLALPGSGGGSGPEIVAAAGSGEGGGDSSPFYASADVLGSWASNLYLTVGEDIEAVLGVEGGITFGIELDMVINPLGLLGGAGPLGAGLAAGFGGALYVYLGSETTLCYGPEIAIHRGPEISYHGKLLSPLTALAITAGLTASAAVVCAGLEPSTADQQLLQFGGTGVAGLMTTLLVMLECYSGEAHAVAQKIEEAEELVQTLTMLNPQLAEQICQATEDRITDGLAIVSGSAHTALTEARTNNEHKVRDGDYTIQANNVTIRSSGAIDPDDIFGSQLSTIHLDASGAGALSETGALIMNASKQASLKVGTASLQLNSVDMIGTLTILNGIPEVGPTITVTDDSITLQIGPPDVGPRIYMTPEGIQLSVGPPDAGATIAMMMSGIFLRFFEWEHTLTPEGINQVVAENTVILNPSGISMEVLSQESQVEASQSISVGVRNLSVESESVEDHPLKLDG